MLSILQFSMYWFAARGCLCRCTLDEILGGGLSRVLLCLPIVSAALVAGPCVGLPWARY